MIEEDTTERVLSIFFDNMLETVEQLKCTQGLTFICEQLNWILQYRRNYAATCVCSDLCLVVVLLY